MPVAPALIMGAAAVGGAAIASKGAKQQSNAIQQSTNDSNALQLRIFEQQRADQQPWMQSGQRALSQIERLLGIQAPAGTASTTPGQVPTTAPGGMGNALSPGGGDRRVVDTGGLNDNMFMLDRTTPIEGGGGKVGPAVTMPATQPATQGADFSGFYQSPGYQFRMQEGMNALTGNAATRGALQSGATQKALLKYGQNYASNEFGQYMNQLFNVAGLGQTSTGQTNALSSNYAANVSNNNMASAQARASSYGTQANAWGNALGTLGGIGSYYLGGRK